MGIEAAIAAAIVSAGASAATAALISSVIVNTVISIGLGALSSALAPKPKTPNLSGSFSNRAQGITQNIKQPVTVRRMLYGEARVGGALTFIETSGNDEIIHVVLTMADHECEAIDEVWFNDVSIPIDYLDGSGNVTSGEFSGHARITKYLGAPGQTADANLVSETSVDSNFIGQGLTYLIARLKFDRDVYPTSVPTITAFTKGKKLLDVRDDTRRYTPNGSLFISDYLISPLDSLVPGAGVDPDDVDEVFLSASANVCEEMVTTQAINYEVTAVAASTDIITLDNTNDTLAYQTGDRVQMTTDGTLPGGISAATNYFVIPFQRKTNLRIKLASTLENAVAGVAIDITSAGSGTHTISKNAEPRYFGGGVIETNEEVGSNLKDLLSTCGADFIFNGGQWKIKAASYQTPFPDVFDESHLLSEVSVQTKASRRDRFNLIKGVYVSPLNEGEAADYPSVTNSTYVAADGGRTMPIDFDLPMTQRPHTAQRLAKIKLEKHRQELFFEASFNLSAMQVQPGDNVKITNARMGWNEKIFEVVKWTLASETQNNVPTFFVKMSLQETASAVYDWNNGEETLVDPAPNTSLPNPLIVDPPTGLAVTPVEIRTAAGDLTYEFVVSWSPPNDIFVVNGGHYDVQFKKTSASTWSRSFRAEDEDTEIRVPQVEPGVNYDVRVRSVNNLGVRSSYQPLFGFTVDSPSGATIRIDDGKITGTVIDSENQGGIADATTATADEGEIN